MTDKKEIKLVFAPGCFDSFEGDQSELDSLMAEIQSMFDSGKMMDLATPVDMDDEDHEAIEQALGNSRTLQ